MDATPVTLGQEFGGYAQADRARDRAGAGGAARASASCRWAEPPWAPASTRRAASPRRHRQAGATDLAFRSPKRATTSRRRAPVTRWSRRRACSAPIAVSLNKIANDIRWMCERSPHRARPRSASPICSRARRSCRGRSTRSCAEAVQQVVAQVIGNDAAVAFAGAAGNFELNVMLPVIARNLLESIRLLASVCASFADKCVAGIEADEERCRTYAESSPAIGTSLNPSSATRPRRRSSSESRPKARTLRDVVARREVAGPRRTSTGARRHGHDQGRIRRNSSAGRAVCPRTGRVACARGSAGPSGS